MKAKTVSTSLQTVIDDYLLEGRRTGQWAGRTLGEVSEFFNTLIEILGEGFDIACLDKSKAKEVKDTLLSLPKNRNINPKTRDLTLDKQLDIADVERLSSVFVGCSAYHEPLKFVVFTDLLATIISILIGVSLAISSILSSPVTISDKVSPAPDGKQRVEEVLKLDSLRLYQGQHIIFWIY